jgi:hypothetical protein
LEALWAPASLLPANGVTWEAIDQERARAVFKLEGERFPLELRVREDGLPLSVVMPRWTNANPDRVFRWQPTGGFVEAVVTTDGYTIPLQMSAGNHFGTNDYFPFFQATVVHARFL